MPFIGLSPFLQRKDILKKMLITSVNALYRAFSISTHYFSVWNNGHKSVSMPFIGLSPFLQTMKIIGKVKKDRVNALYRAFSISTLPSGNALKWSICRLDFAGNCLTTSKSAYFLLFLCLFTLCSYFVTVQHKKIIDNTMSLFIVLLILFLW